MHIYEHKAFFKALRRALRSLPQSKSYVQRRTIIPTLLAVAEVHVLSQSLRRFVDQGLAAHGLDKNARAYKASKTYASMLQKWNKSFHIKKCKICENKIPLSTRTKPLEPQAASYCSRKCQNGDPITREKNRQGIKRLMDNPKRKAEFLKKTQATAMRMYGVSHKNQAQVNRDKISKAGRKLWACETYQEMRRTSHSGFKRRKHSCSLIQGSKSIITWQGLQGYEPLAIQHLVNECGVIPWTIASGKYVPTFVYRDAEGLDRTYFPDLLIGDNTVVEVKSTYTLKMNPGKIRAKIKAAFDAGYNVILLVMNPNGSVYARTDFLPLVDTDFSASILLGCPETMRE